MNKFITLMAILRRKAHLPAVVLLALLSGLAAKADVVIDATNFPDETFRNFLLSGPYIYDDTELLSHPGADGVFTSYELAHIYEFDLRAADNYGDISSLQGIEYFTELFLLCCNDMQLTSLDVSNNTKLTHFYFDNNQLTSIDVSKLSRLFVFSCAGNQLTALDVSNNPSLAVLHCSNNQLTTLEVGNKNDFRILTCNNNQLTELDLSTAKPPYDLTYSNQTRTLTAQSAVTPEGRRYYYLPLGNYVDGDKSIVERMTETNAGGVASKFDPSRVLEWTSGVSVSDGILYLTDVTEDPTTNTASGTVKYKYNINNSSDPDGSKGNFTLNWTAPMPEVPTPGPAALELNEKVIHLQVKQSFQLEVLTPNAGEITWTSDNPEAVEVDSTGRITALKNGKAVITATAANGSSTWCGVVSYKLGDLNEDMKVDIADMNMITNIILTQE